VIAKFQPHTDELVLATPDLNKPHRWQEYEFFDSTQEWDSLRDTKGLVRSGRPHPAENYIVKRFYHCSGTVCIGDDNASTRLA